MSDAPATPLEHLQQLTRLMQSAAQLHDWPRVTALNERRNQILHGLTNIDAAHHDELQDLIAAHNALVSQVNQVQASLEKQRAYLGVSRQAVGRYLAVERGDGA